MMRLLVILAGVLIPAGLSIAQDTTSGLKLHFPLEETAPFSDAIERVSGSTAATNAYNANTRLNPGFLLNGSQGVVYHPAVTITNRLTITAWVKPWFYDNSAGGAYGYHNIIGKSDGGSGRPIAWQLYLHQGRPALRCNWLTSGGTPSDPALSTDNPLPLGTWQHLAVTSDGTSVRFFINGAVVKTITQSITFGSSYGFLVIGDVENFGRGFRGGVWDVRVYDRALANADIGSLAASPPPLRISTNYQGLWSGRAQLNEVKEAATGTWSTTPAAFPETLLLHVDSGGNPRLLSEATLMQTRVTAPALPQPIVVSQPSLIPNFDGITRRGGRLIGQRFSSATVIVPPAARLEDIGGGFYRADIPLSGADPLNPFRHKYHPDLASGRAIQRSISFSLPPSDSPSDNTVTGVLMESIGGLNKTTLEARGPITFTRVSTSGKLNQP